MSRGRSKTAAWKAVGNYIVCVHGADSPGELEWDQILSLFRLHPDIRKARVLVFTLGGAPDALQRTKLNQLLGTAKPPIAVLTPSAIARAAGIAISWFNPSIKIFDPDATREAFDHLDSTQLERTELSRVLADLRRELGV